MAYRLLFDLEGDGLLPELTKIHCIAAVDPDTRQRFSWRPHELPQAYETLDKADTLVAHYGIGYDFPAMKKVAGFVVPKHKQKDSVVIAKLIVPNLRDTDGLLVEKGKLPSELHGSHKLRAWGFRLGVPKADYEGPWGEWSEQMHSYMDQDVETLLAIWNHLAPDEYSQEAIELEHRIQHLCNKMEEAGWPFDSEKAVELHAKLTERHAELHQQLVEQFGYWFEPKVKKKLPDGTYEPFVPKRDDKARGYVKEQPCTRIEKVTFNPSSRPHIIRSLSKLGWKPQAFTESGQPKLDDEILETLSKDIPSTSKIVEYLLLDKRIGQLATGDKAWLKQVGADGKMHGSINPMGTASSRAAHFNPNLGQVPATKSPYGKECRQLFTVPKGWKLVGADMSSLQLRCLGHYLAPFDDGEYGKAVVSGDPHWRAVRALGLSDKEARDDHDPLDEVLREKGGKTFGYATIFGCFDKKAGSIVRECLQTAMAKGIAGAQGVYDKFFGQGQTNNTVGSKVRGRYYEQLGLGRLLAKLKSLRTAQLIRVNGALKKHRWPGTLPGLDGRFVPARSDHSSLAFLLQSAEAILCKRWICDADEALAAAGYTEGWDGDYVCVGWIHDEVQFAVREGLENEVGTIIVRCAETAGEPYGFRVPLASKFKVGRTWADTH